VALPRLKRKLGPDRLVAAGALATAAALALFGVVREPLAGVLLCFGAGAAWILVLATLYVSAQIALPDWARGRGLAIFLTVIFGAMTCGGAIWGKVAQAIGLPAAHFMAAACVLLALPLTSASKIETGAAVDLSPSGHWRLPEADHEIDDVAGPVLVLVEYRVADVHRDAFMQTIREVGRERKRDGAYAWGMFQDPRDHTRLWESFLIESWLEFRFFCERVTKSDRLVEDRLQGLLASSPSVTVMIAAE
jgi:MFS family permease